MKLSPAMATSFGSFWLATSLLLGSAEHAIGRSLRSNLPTGLGVDMGLNGTKKKTQWNPFTMFDGDGLDIYQNQGALQLNLELEGCEADPANCGSAMDAMSTMAAVLLNKTMLDNATLRKEVADIEAAFDKCEGDRTSSTQHFTNSLTDTIESHKKCRLRENNGSQTLSQLRSVAAVIQGHMDYEECNSEWTPKPQICTCPNDAVEFENINTSETTLDNHVLIFHNEHKDYVDWKTDCDASAVKLAETQKYINETDIVYKRTQTDCENLLKGVETLSCNWAHSMKDRADSHLTCWRTATKQWGDMNSVKAQRVLGIQETWKVYQMINCMAAAVSADGGVDAEAMVTCKNNGFSNIDQFVVPLKGIPIFTQYDPPDFYGGSVKFRESIYDDSGKVGGVAVRQPTLCLAWKGGCWATPVFAGAPFAMKSGSNYCDLQFSGPWKGFVKCWDANDKFPRPKFAFKNSDSCSENLTLTTFSAGRTCVYRNITGQGNLLPLICPEWTPTLDWANPKLANFDVDVEDGSLLPSGRSGNVMLKSTATLDVNMSTWAGSYSWGSLNDYSSKKAWSCGEDNGLMWRLQGQNYKEKTRWTSANRKFKAHCRWLHGYFGKLQNAVSGGNQVLHKTGLKDSFEKACTTNSVLISFSVSDYSDGDYKFEGACRKLPPMLELSKDSRRWTNWSSLRSDWDLKCGEPDVNAVVVGYASKWNGDSQDREWQLQCSSLVYKTTKVPVTLEYMDIE